MAVTGTRTSSVREGPVASPIWLRCFLAAVLSISLGACATQPADPPTAALDAAQDAISRADHEQAAEYAGEELQQARERLAAANQAVDDGDMVRAERRAVEARLAAELAAARAEVAESREVNEELARSIAAIEEQADLDSGGDR